MHFSFVIKLKIAFNLYLTGCFGCGSKKWMLFVTYASYLFQFTIFLVGYLIYQCVLTTQTFVKNVCDITEKIVNL